MTQQIKLTKGKFALVDDEDYFSLSQYHWFLSSNGYAVRNRLKSDPHGTPTHVYMHRAILSTATGLDTDHINTDKLDNRRSNLRPCTRTENKQNTIKRANAETPYKGVAFHQRAGKFRAEIVVNSKRIYLGLYLTAEAAARAYDNAASIYFGNFARLNFPKE